MEMRWRFELTPNSCVQFAGANDGCRVIADRSIVKSPYSVHRNVPVVVGDAMDDFELGMFIKSSLSAT